MPVTEDSLDGHDLILTVCHALGFTLDTMKEIVQIFFEAFTSFRLFREPVFLAELGQCPSELALRALLAIIVAFARKTTRGKISTDYSQLSPADFADLALHDVDAAMAECGDEPPSLCLLQALILVTHWLLIRGVRGRAWRYLGLCMRVALELRLFALDEDKDPDTYTADAEQWCQDEEQRRAFWAIWEMDQFANHLKHVPMTIDWTQSHVFLPAEDERWFRGQPQQSCFLEPDLIARSKALHATGSKSARAWYIVLASLNPEAHDLAYPSEAIRYVSRREVTSKKKVDTSRESACSTIFRAIQLCVILLPLELKFYGQYLDFGTRTFGRRAPSSTLHSQSSIYLLAMMPEIARLLALRPYVFDAYARKLLNVTDKDPHRKTVPPAFAQREGLAREIEQCTDAAEAVLNIVVNCHESHYQYVNPYVVSASWLAATTHLLLRELTEDESEKNVIWAKFEVLKATNDRFIQHWEMSTVPKQNLDALAERLKLFRAHSESVTQCREETAAGSSTRTQARPKSPPFALYPSSHNRRNRYWSFDRTRPSHGSIPSPEKDTPPHSNIISDKVRAASLLPPRHEAVVAAAPVQGHNAGFQDGTQIHTQQLIATPNTMPFPSQVSETSMRANVNTNTNLDNGLDLISLHSQDLKPQNPITGTVSALESAFGTQCEAAGFGQPHVDGSMNADPLDWFSLSSNAELGGDLLDYLDVFSGPFLG
ncbi:Fungal specific transcription factor domain-containing protein [Cladophialophora immunda]|nr:Fungal specific transcription factor domain-containing protein [Cladophialophora immunda]